MKLLDTLMAANVDDYPEEKIIYDPKPIRLFKSDFLEFFTHVSPLAIVLIWLPVAIYFLIRGLAEWPVAASSILAPLLFVLGILIVWTFAEYIIHRFIFHMETRGRTAYQIVFLFHGIHHVQPAMKTRLVMPPVVSLPMGIVAYVVFYLLFDRLFGAPHLMLPLLSGFTLGYITYDLTHYATHHSRTRSQIMKFLKRHHMEHHYKTPHARFGVTSNIWDLVFNTEPPVAGPLPVEPQQA